MFFSCINMLVTLLDERIRVPIEIPGDIERELVDGEVFKGNF